MAASLSQILPAVFVFFFIGVVLVVGSIIAGKLPQWREKARKRLSENHIDLLPDGRVKLGVENISHEEYMDRMQRVFVGTVNNSHANLPSRQSTIPGRVERCVLLPSGTHTYDWLTIHSDGKTRMEKRMEGNAPSIATLPSEQPGFTIGGL